MKSARIDGETLGKYHPHGGVYGTMGMHLSCGQTTIL